MLCLDWKNLSLGNTVWHHLESLLMPTSDCDRFSIDTTHPWRCIVWSCIIPFLALLYESTESYCCHIDIGVTLYSFILNFFILWAKHCQGSYHVRGQVLLYSQTCLCGHLYKGITCLQLFSRSLDPKYSANEPVLRGHLSWAAIFCPSLGWPLKTGLTVYVFMCFSDEKE